MTGHSSSDDSWNAGARTESVRHLKKVSFAGGFGYDYFDGRNMRRFRHVYRTGLSSRGYSRIYAGPRKWPRTIPSRAAFGPCWGGAGRAACAWSSKLQNYAEGQGPASHNEHAARLRILARRDVPCGPFRRGRGLYRGHEQRTRSRGDRLHARIVSGFLRPRSGLRLAAALESSDMHLTTSGVTGFPVRENTQGAGVQLQSGPVYAAAAYRNRQGETGERGMIWHEFGTHQVTANAALSLGNLQRRHFVRLNLDWRSLQTDENIITTETVNGVTKPYIHGLDAHLRAQGARSGGRVRICKPLYGPARRRGLFRSSTANRR